GIRRQTHVGAWVRMESESGVDEVQGRA
nr:hypothetical protein [Tanacetum cinerariifolium]